MFRYVIILTPLLIIIAVLVSFFSSPWTMYKNERFGYSVFAPENTSNFPEGDFMKMNGESGDVYDHRWFSDFTNWDEPVDFGSVTCYESLPYLSAVPMLGIEADTHNEQSLGDLNLAEFTELVFSQFRNIDVVETLTQSPFLNRESYTFSIRKMGTFSPATHKYIFTKNNLDEICIIELPVADHGSNYKDVTKLRQEWIDSFEFTAVP